MWIVINKHTKEKRIVSEQVALDLDQREWFKQEGWNCTDGHERDVPRLPGIVVPREFGALARRCGSCNGFHKPVAVCTEPLYRRFGE